MIRKALKDVCRGSVLLTGRNQFMQNWPETNASLIQRIKDSADQAAWSQFLAIYRPVVVRLATSRGLQHADAEDLAQQVFCSVAGAIEKYQPRRKDRQFRYWLVRISRNAIVNALTRVPSSRCELWDVERLCEQPEKRDEALSAELLRLARVEAIRWAAKQVQPEFSDETWQMFWLSTVAEHSSQEVAARLQKSRGAVYIARCRVTQRIKEILEQSSDLWSELQ